MSEWSGVLDCFVTPIYNKVLNLNHQQINDYLLKIEKTLKSVEHGDNLYGFQSNELWDSHKEQLKKFNFYTEIQTALQEYSDKAGLMPLEIKRIWFSVMRYKDMVSLHSHNDSVVSGTYYPSTPKYSGNIQFAHPAKDVMEVLWRERALRDYNEYTGRLVTPRVTTGRCILYPGYLKHWVEPHLNEEEPRVAISFTAQTVKEKIV